MSALALPDVMRMVGVCAPPAQLLASKGLTGIAGGISGQTRDSQGASGKRRA